MTEKWHSTAEPLVLHVIPTPIARGAQREARALADRLDAPSTRAHRVLTLFDGPSEVRTDYALGVGVADATGGGYRPGVVPRLRRALTGLDPVMVVAHGGEPLKYLVPAMLGHHRPLAYYAIGTYAGPPGRSLQVRIWRILAGRADVVVAEGPDVAVECTDLLGVPAERVVTIPNGRDPEEFRPRPPGPATGPPVVLFVGALTEGKGPDRFVDLVGALRRSGVDVRARMVGDGPLRDALATRARDAGVEMLGMRSDVASLMSDSDLMVFPSRPAGEGMPGVLIEAGLSALPVVATRVPGVDTVILDGETGYIVDGGDATTLVDPVTRLIEDEALRTAMGTAARERCRLQFGLDAVAARWLEALTPLLAGAGAG